MKSNIRIKHLCTFAIGVLYMHFLYGKFIFWYSYIIIGASRRALDNQDNMYVYVCMFGEWGNYHSVYYLLPIICCLVRVIIIVM